MGYSKFGLGIDYGARMWLLGSSAKCIERERKALVTFKHGLNDPSGRLSSWKGDDCCRWSGVRCNNISGHVVKLDLRNSFPIPSVEDYNSLQFYEKMTYESQYQRSLLRGNISSSLLQLKYLNYLDLSVNCFEGIQIPKFLGMFEHLKYLNLSSSFFSGEIPPHLGNLSNLRYLHLGFDTIFTANLEWLSHLSSLKYLKMENIGVYDTDWLQSINMLPNLVELHLPSCFLPSLPLSLSFVNLTLLSVLDISGNVFNSSIPNWLSNLTILTELHLSTNHFNGASPREFVNFESLEDLDLSDNDFKGQIPRFFENLCKLKILDLSTNNFNSGVVEFFGGFSGCPTNSLVSLNLGSNSFGGELPDSIGRFKNLQHLYLFQNSFWGSIPTSIGNLSNLQELDMSENEMNGSIPFGQLSNLIKLNLNWNSWESVVTEAQLINLTRLEYLSIRLADNVTSLVFNVTYEWIPPFRLEYLELKNCLVGPRFPIWVQVQSDLAHVVLKNVGIIDTIPEQWFSMLSSKVTYLDVSGNQINGKLPIHLAYPNLHYLDLSNNRFEGSLPLWSTNVSVLYINNNSFAGPIPSNIAELMPRLRLFYMFENRLSGTIPSSICTMEDLEYLILRTNQLSGEIPQCWNESQNLIFMDVASNNLSGNIPSSLGLLSSLKVLMLSNNHLQGEIPPSLQKCNLTLIDLGGNKLSGKLPLWIGERATAQILRLTMVQSHKSSHPRSCMQQPFWSYSSLFG
ncbi:receptor-like protein EIX1 [Cornus florida]|uniref:receptor-like protein EIX1 n=1 Tax=Cornus florida TaxID=4283 RepID=UPI00289A3AF0|nr:receptor-like protein EIX1 [Cornus florida]